MSAKEIYSALVQLTIHAESITWNRFYNFLMGNSVLVLAWATIFGACNRRCAAVLAMVVICLLGGLSGVVWAALGDRGRTFLEEYIALGDRMERDNALWPKGFGEYRPFGETDRIGYLAGGSWARSRPILKFGPWLFTALYVVLLVASLIG